MFSNKNEKETAFLVVDDHPAIRVVLKQIIHKISNLKPTISETGSLSELIEMVKQKNYDMVILDGHVDDGITLTAIPIIKMKNPDTKILFFSVLPEDVYAQQLIQMGADGFLHKKASENEINAAITRVLSGRKYLSADLLYTLIPGKDFPKKGEENPFLLLSHRELEIVTLILQGKSNKEISILISVSASTVSTHKARIFEKLRVPNEIELTTLATNYGFNSH